MDKFWDFIENILHFILFRIFHLRMNDGTWKKLCQFVKFGVVGLSNTLISYILKYKKTFFFIPVPIGSC